jgi:exonuclease III
MMQHQQPPRPFKVAAVNVNGLVERKKRQRFFQWLQQQRYAVALLSETHCTSAEQAQQWVREGAGNGKPWQGAAAWCNQAQQGGRAAGGVAVLLSDSICGASTQPVVEHQSPSGRVLKVSWDTPWGQRLAAAAVYAPCTQQDRADFFLGEYLDAMTSGTQQGLIVGGDFNCVMRPEDVRPLPGQQPNA